MRQLTERSNNVSDVIEPKVIGIDPPKRLLFIPNEAKFIKLPAVDGSGPENEFEANWRQVKAVNCPIEEGMFPLNRLE